MASKNAKKGTRATCRHCGHPIWVPGQPGRWRDASGFRCDADPGYAAEHAPR